MTAIRYGHPIVCVVLNNEKLGFLALEREANFGLAKMKEFLG